MCHACACQSIANAALRAWSSPSALPNFGVKLMRPGFGPAAELPTSPQARRRHVGCSSPLGSTNVIGGNRRAATAPARGTGRTAYTKDVSRTTKTSCEANVAEPTRAHPSEHHLVLEQRSIHRSSGPDVQAGGYR
jgi:hypothetical protein